jgi:RNA polymerase sigma factor (sigma-70 family)
MNSGGNRSNKGFISLEKERELISRWQMHEDEFALNELLAAYHPFLAKMARKQSRMVERQKDLIQEGILAIMDALGNFSPRDDVRFLSYAASYVKAAMVAGRYSLDQVIDIPRHRMHAANAGRIEDGKASLLQALGRKVSLQDAGDDVAVAMDACPQEAILRRQAQEYLRECLEAAFCALSEDEKGVIRLRLEDSEYKCGAIASRLGITPGRARVLEMRAMNRLRSTLIAQGFSTSYLVTS